MNKSKEYLTRLAILIGIFIIGSATGVMALDNGTFQNLNVTDESFLKGNVDVGIQKSIQAKMAVSFVSGGGAGDNTAIWANSSTGEFSTGVWGHASSSGGSAIGGRFTCDSAVDADACYGIYAESKMTDGWAGYFAQGNVHVQDKLSVGSRVIIGDSGRIVDINGITNTDTEGINVNVSYSNDDLGTIYGVRSTAMYVHSTADASDNYYAGWFNAIGDNAKDITYGIYANAVNGATNWAGYFANGDVYIKDKLAIGTINPTSVLDMYDYSVNDGAGANINTDVEDDVTYTALNVSLKATPQYSDSGNLKGINVKLDSAATEESSWGPHYGIYSEAKGGYYEGVMVGLYATASGAYLNYAAIFDQGNVGIGTTTPTEKLEVNGTIKAAYKSSDGTAGITTTCSNVSSITVKNGLIVACS